MIPSSGGLENIKGGVQLQRGFSNYDPTLRPGLAKKYWFDTALAKHCPDIVLYYCSYQYIHNYVLTKTKKKKLSGLSALHLKF